MVQPPYLRTHVAETDGMVVFRTSRHLSLGDPSITDMEFAYLVTSATDGSSYFVERHVMGVYPAARYVEAFDRAGLIAEFLEEGTELARGLVIGVRQS
jgi:hypothetical protein